MLFNWFKNNRSGKQLPDFWAEYLRLMEHPPGPDTPLRDISFTVFDTETTGLDTRKDRILSIGAIKVRHWNIPLENSFEVFLQQQYKPASANIEIHGILPVDRAGSLDEKAALQKFLQYAGNSVLVGHHIRFDIRMMNSALRRANAGKLCNPVLDTAALAARLNPTAYYPDPGGRHLDRLCERFGIPLNDRHTAAGDAFLTSVLLLKILARLETRGVHTLKDLLRR